MQTNTTKAKTTNIPASPPRGPEENRAVAKMLGKRGANHLYVLGPDNDPFAIGRPSHTRDAEWFAGLWEEFAFGDGVHLRRIHYRIVADGNRLLPDDRPYQNSLTCWNRLTLAAKFARILGMVDVEAFVDRRNQPTIRHRKPRDSEPELDIIFPDVKWRLPELDPDLLSTVSITLGSPLPVGYEYDPDDQPVLLEVWVEKSTMRDILQPLCQRLKVNYAEAKGFESITHAAELVRRAQEHGKPVHVLYVSDFDPAGESMPIAVGRSVQYWREELGVEEHVSIEPIILTRDQVSKYNLPREPVKDTDRRGGKFHEKHGDEGATELDALEALYPGELAKVARQAIASWTDPELEKRLRDTGHDAEIAISRAWNSESAELLAEIERLQEEARAAAAEVAPQITQLISEQLRNLEPFEQRAEELRTKAREIYDRLDVELPERPMPVIDIPANRRLLFDTRRDWVEQLEIFKANQNGKPGH